MALKEQIIQTSLVQFQKHGIREISIQALVAPLGISTKTVYKHFSSKEDLLEHVLTRLYDEQFEMLTEMSSTKNTMQLFVQIWYISCSRQLEVKTIFHDDLEYYYPELKQKVERLVGKKFTSQFISIIERGMKEGVFRADIVPFLVLNSIYTLLTLTIRNSVLNHNTTAHDVFLNTICVYIKGICTLKGIKGMDTVLADLPPLGFKKVDRR